MEEDGTVLVDAVLRLPEWTGLTLADLLEIVDRSVGAALVIRGLACAVSWIVATSDYFFCCSCPFLNP
jgi:hypothetical protein